MKTKLVFVLLVVFLSIQKTYSQDWNYVGYSTRYGHYYINSAYLSKDGQKIKIWAKREFEKQVYVKKGKSKIKKTVTNEEKILYEFDCENQRLMHHYSIIYNSDGSATQEYDPLDYQKEWSVIIPGSVGESLLNKVCELYNF